uniref:VENN motif pre-toxin domain-containing protein n=1 Tax=Moraxella bovis TaxID=476 RepID=UPI0015963566|nr:VENN motif pre-toxin domain-containing protein [Moraxella bovis]
MQRELDVQVQVTQSFDQNRREIRTQYATKAEAYREDAKQAREQGNTTLAKTLEEKANQIDDNLRLYDGITSALYAPNSNGIVGDTVRAVSPQVAYQIGQYFKANDAEQSASHLLAHALLGAATSYATGNDIASGALAGATSEVAAPILAEYLYHTDDPEKLTQEQKDTITSIITLAGATATYSATGDVGDAVNASEVGKVGVENNYFYPIRNEKRVDILDLNIQGDERYVVYALAEYMVKQRMLELYDVPSFVYSDMVSGNSIVDFDTKETINENPTEEDYRKNFNTGNIISHDQFEVLIKKHPQAYNRLIEGISNQKTLDGIKDLGLKVTGGLSGVAVSFGQIGEPILHPIETAKALYQFVTTEDKLLAIQLAVAMDLQNRQELLELHHQNNDTFGVALETSKNTADALLVLGSIHKAPKEIATLIPTLKQAGTVVFNGVKYTMEQGKIVAQKIITPNTNVNTNVPANQNLPNVYGDGDLNNVYDYRTPLRLDDKKFDYFFGKVDSSDHNHYRSLQNQRQLNSIGIFDNEFGKSLLTGSINKQIQNPSNVIDRERKFIMV